MNTTAHAHDAVVVDGFRLGLCALDSAAVVHVDGRHLAATSLAGAAPFPAVFVMQNPRPNGV